MDYIHNGEKIPSGYGDMLWGCADVLGPSDAVEAGGAGDSVVVT